MKINLLLPLMFAVLIANAQIKTSNYTYDDIPAMEQKAQSAKFKSVLSSAADNYNVIYHRCVWSVDPAVNAIKGNITTYFKPTISGFNQMEFDLAISLIVDSVKYHSSNLSFTQLATDILRINLVSTIPINTIDSITVFYQGVPPSNGFGSFIQSTHSGVPILWTLSEPYGAKDWWPCKQSLNDKIDSLDIIVTVPQVNRVGSNGVLLSENIIGTDKVFHWKTKYPIAAYLVAIAVTNYSYYSDFVPLQSGGSLEVLNYVYPENLATAQAQTPDIINVIKFYDSLTIEYPFAKEKYGHAQFNWGGGMEHQTMTFLINFGHALMAHECAHQWFGDHVTCGSWQDIWLNEGFATYFEGLTEERYFPSTWMSWKTNKLGNITSQPGGSVLCDDTTSVNRIFDGRLSYDKGGYLLHMLRWKLGDSLFFLALKNYLNDPLISGAYAHTPQLKAHLEAVSGQNLTAFFDQWYYKQGFPSYHILYGQTGSAVSVTANQTQSNASVAFFEMPIPIKFIGQTQDTTIVFDNQSSGQVFSATVNFPIISAQFDPELWLISANNTMTGISEYPSVDNQVSIYPNPAKDIVNILSLNNANAVEFIEITDVLGQLVFQSDKYKGIQKTISINTTGLKKGTYFIKVTLRSGVNYKSFVKE